MIKERRLSKNMTQGELAKELGVSRTTVTMWETGASRPTADKLPTLAQVLGCTIDELFRA
ncbi:MAG: helix-turn-helix transcriptional regulator [Oscillospiraceae bacterium]|nr:helix-turn-helix transcriptional regulator [Oscillospiraceae bacterium]